MDVDTFGQCFNPSERSTYSRVLISHLKKDGLVETFDGLSVGVLHRKMIRISQKGRQLLDHHYGLKRHIHLGQDIEIPEAKTFYPHRLPVFRNAYENPGRTHFNRTDLTRLWLQIRCIKPSRMTVLWDFIKTPESLPLIGNPDLVMFNGMDIAAGHLKKLCVVEWEFGEKPNHVIYDRLDETTRNPDLLFMFIVSPHMTILKNWAQVIRKHVPGSSSYSHKNSQHQFHPRFLNEQHHLTKIFMVHWNPSDHPIHSSEFEGARCLRFDHEEFDLYNTNIKVTAEGRKVREKIPFNRFQGKQEVVFRDLMRFMVDVQHGG